MLGYLNAEFFIFQIEWYVISAYKDKYDSSSKENSHGTKVVFESVGCGMQFVNYGAFKSWCRYLGFVLFLKFN